MSLTIFQRMLVAPVAAMSLYGAYLYVTYGEHRLASLAITEIRDESLPVMTLSAENIQLFESVVSQFKDAVLAGERAWLDSIEENRAKIEGNLDEMAQYHQVVDPKEIAALRQDFSAYYANAHALSLALLGDRITAEARYQLIDHVERFHNAVSETLLRLRATAQQRVNVTVEETNRRLSRLLLLGLTMGVLLLILIIALTFALSMATRRSLREMITRMRDLAEGRPDFGKRLSVHSNDELGLLVNWFNQLSEKLELDYKKIELLSITDKLTQLYNRTKIDQLLEEELRRAVRYDQSLALILIDLDHFKSVNDEYGHHVGDEVLREMAQLLRDSVRATDSVGRWGGEEFIVIAPNTNLPQALVLAEKLRTRVAGHAFPVIGGKTASLGVAVLAEDDTEESLTRRADQALYLAKEQGRNRAVSESLLMIRE